MIHYTDSVQGANYLRSQGWTVRHCEDGVLIMPPGVNDPYHPDSRRRQQLVEIIRFANYASGQERLRKDYEAAAEAHRRIEQMGS